MYKTVLIAFIICFLAYVPFSRRPDYFDSSFTTGKVIRDAKGLTMIQFEYGKKNTVNIFDPAYLWTNYQSGQTVKVIYEEAHPKNAAVYRFWGYWVRWKEILLCVVIYFGLLRLSMAITSNPSPESEESN